MLFSYQQAMNKLQAAAEAIANKTKASTKAKDDTSKSEHHDDGETTKKGKGGLNSTFPGSKQRRGSIQRESAFIMDNASSSSVVSPKVRRRSISTHETIGSLDMEALKLPKIPKIGSSHDGWTEEREDANVVDELTVTSGRANSTMDMAIHGVHIDKDDDVDEFSKETFR